MLGSSALTLWQTKICRMALLHVLGHVCKFVLRCKNIYRIGPRLFCLWMFSVFLCLRSFSVILASMKLKVFLSSPPHPSKDYVDTQDCQIKNMLDSWLNRKYFNELVKRAKIRSPKLPFTRAPCWFRLGKVRSKKTFLNDFYQLRHSRFFVYGTLVSVLVPRPYFKSKI